MTEVTFEDISALRDELKSKKEELKLLNVKTQELEKEMEDVAVLRAQVIWKLIHYSSSRTLKILIGRLMVSPILPKPLGFKIWW